MISYISKKSRISTHRRAFKRTYPRLPAPRLIADLATDHLAQESAAILTENSIIVQIVQHSSE